MERPARIAIAGGGTGGHVFPALGIADAIRAAEKETVFLFFGTAGKIESTIVPERGYPFRSIWISGFQRSFRPSNLLFPVKAIVSLMQSWGALRSFKPDVVVGTGGYVCGPVLYAASLAGIPTVLHESNSYPGMTTRILAKRVYTVLSGFGGMEAWLPKGVSVEVVGTPVRSFVEMPSTLEARKEFGFDEQDCVVLVLGGSQGSASINTAIDDGLQTLTQSGIRLIWQTGRSQADRYMTKHHHNSRVVIKGFLDDVVTAYSAADLVVSRAGASTLAELAVLGKPAILVPYPHAVGDHQMKNARFVEERGGATVVPNADVGRSLVAEIRRLQENLKEREAMALAMEQLARPDAAATIANKVLSLVDRS